MRVTLEEKQTSITLLPCPMKSSLECSKFKKIQTLTFPLPFRQHHNHALPTTLRERIRFLSHQLRNNFLVLLPRPSVGHDRRIRLHKTLRRTLLQPSTMANFPLHCFVPPQRLASLSGTSTV